MKFDVEAMCRLNGRRPSMRDMWTAFYRLYRAASRNTHIQHETDLQDCLRVLVNYAPFFSLAGAPGDRLAHNNIMPTVIRWHMLKRDKERRLYGDHPEWKERDKVVARVVRDSHGYELTPTQVAEVRRKVINMARAKALEMGFVAPEDDDELLAMLRDE